LNERLFHNGITEGKGLKFRQAEKFESAALAGITQAYLSKNFKMATFRRGQELLELPIASREGKSHFPRQKRKISLRAGLSPLHYHI
jgi:hypothetical protein